METGFVMCTKVVSTQAGIEKLKIKGRVQVIFNPLIQRLPVIAAIKVKLVNAAPYVYNR